MNVNELEMHTEVNGSNEIVTTIIGELDTVTAPQFLARCRREPIASDVYDCRFVSLLTAAGISALLEACTDHRCRIVGSPVVARVLNICGLSEFFGVSEPDTAPWLHRAEFGVAVHDTELRYIYVNDFLADLNGLAAQAHYGHRPSELFDIGHDDVLPVVRDVLVTGIDRELLVRGDTGAVVDGQWRCRYRRVRYRTAAGLFNVVIATVKADSTRPSSAGARVVFSNGRRAPRDP